MSVGFRATAALFDTDKVTDRIDRVKRRFLFTFGAYVRTRARQSIKSGGKSNKRSKPGDPPKFHTPFLKKGILFAVNTSRESVVIGPVVVPTEHGGPGALSALEEGGMVSIREIVGGGGGGRNASGQFKKKKRLRFTGKMTRTRIKARPFMGPAFEKEKANISTIWRKSGR
jgi:hypothetical protein